MKYIGIDGCRAGWFLCCLDKTGTCHFKLLEHIRELDAYLATAKSVLIDIPIGLHTRQPQERSCDKQARQLLGWPRSASVFAAPSRCALNCKSYQTANSQNKACTGRGLSRQCFGILPKIREVDSYLENTRRHGRIREMHPELGLWTLNREQAMVHNKKTEEGYAERVAVLAGFLPGTSDLIAAAMTAYPRSQVARDDIVDAMVGAVLARQAKLLRTLPEIPEYDDKGLVMEIVY